MSPWSQPCKLQRPGPGKRRAFAFTLVEMMVAMGLVTFILMVLIQMVDVTSKAWNSGTRRVDAFREARAALHIIERDFAGLKTDWYSKADLANPDAFKNVKGLPIILEDGDEISGLTLEGPAKDNTQGIFFLTTTGDLTVSPSQRQPEDGDLCNVGYYVAYAKDGDSERRIYKLYRYFKPSKTTFDRLYKYLDADEPVNQDTFLTDTNRGGPDPKTADYHEALAFNVTDFSVKAYYYDADGEVAEFDPAEAVKPLPPAVLEAGDDPENYSLMPARPDFLEITLGVLGNQSVAKLPPNTPSAWDRSPLGAGTPTDTAARIVSQEARIFTTRIDCR